MTTIHFVRHGQTDWNAARRIQGTSESDLTDAGRAQAAALRSRWAGKTFDRVYSSDLRRCRQTTAILVNDEIDQVDFRPALREIHLGPWEGMMLDDAIEQYPEQAHNFRSAPHLFDLPEAETFYALQQRAQQALAEILAESAGKEVLVVSHGAFLKSLLIDYANREMAQFWQAPEMHNCAQSTVVWRHNAKPQITLFCDEAQW